LPGALAVLRVMAGEMVRTLAIDEIAGALRRRSGSA